MIRIDMLWLCAATVDMGSGTERPRLVAGNLSFTGSMLRCGQTFERMTTGRFWPTPEFQKKFRFVRHLPVAHEVIAAHGPRAGVG
jgi:hypothetical protein